MNYAVEPSEAVGMSARRLERIRPAMQAYVDRGVYAGINTLIARRGKVVHAGQFGWRDKEAGQAMTADTIFRLYSMTKPIVCVALMTLLEEARFRLIDPVAKYIPAFGAVKVLEADGSLVAPVRPVLLRDLMTHMSGLSYHFVEEAGVGKMYQGGKLLDAQCPLEAAIEDLARFPLAFQPGSRWRYSVGIDVAARVIEVISGRALGEFLRDRLFAPLGMADTAFGVSPEKRNRLAAMYGRPDVITPGPTMGSEFAAWMAGVNDHIDVSKSYPVGLAGCVHARRPWSVQHHRRLFPLRPDAGQRRRARRRADPWAQDARAYALEFRAGGAPAARNRRLAPARLRLRPWLAGAARCRPIRGARVGGRVRLVGSGEDPVLGRSKGTAGRPLHDSVDDELRPAGTRSPRARLSGD